MSLSTRIDIYTYQTGEYKGITNVPIKVTAEKHWDKLSKAFKKHTHTIQYLESGTYVSSKYNIRVSGPIASGSKYYYDRPTKKVEAVEVYFWTNDNVNNKEPLIVGFFHENIGSSSSKSYYCWSVLKTRGSTGSISGVESISEKDLINGLLEELGRTSMTGRQNKLVIRLERPDGPGGLQYPESKHFKDKKITVTKETFTDVEGLEKYVHTNINYGVEDFYLSYERNSMYFLTESRLGSEFGSLSKVAVYYKTVTGRENPVLITFSFTGRPGKLYVYSYSQFVKDLKKYGFVNPKTISESDAISDAGGRGSELRSRLEAEREKLKESITFVDDGDNTNENISTQQHEVGDGTKFKKDVLTPNTNDAKEGSSVGPWEVRNGKLIGHESGKKIGPESVLRDITTSRVTDSNSKKYKTITVFYALTGERGTDHKALLVEFDPGSHGGGTKKYIKRTNKGGTEWADANSDISGSAVDEEVLTSIGISAGIIEGSKPGSIASAGHSPAGSQDGNLAATVGGSIAGVGGVGAGVGYAIYKYPQVFLSLIGR